MSLGNTITQFLLSCLLVSLVTSNECPEFCTCSVTHGHQTQNHAKCSSLDGLTAEVWHIPIHSLDLSHLNLTRITNHLEKFRDLVDLDLSHNNLSELSKVGKRVKTLNLSYNKMTSGKLWKIFSQIENLDLSYNEITYLPLDLKNLKHLKSIELTGNTINCTCETLEVRNWLQERNVWTDNHIKCSYPAEVKGQPWLRVKQDDICGYHDTKPRSIALRLEKTDDDENDLMLGDQPVVDGSGDKDSAEELGKDFLPVDEKKNKSEDNFNVDEGSGDVFDAVTLASIISDIENSDLIEQNNETSSEGDHMKDGSGSGNGSGSGSGDGDEGSGSGGGFAFRMPRIRLVDPDDYENFNGTEIPPSDNEFDEGKTDEDETPIPPPYEHTTENSDIFGNELGIAVFDVAPSPATESAEEVHEEVIVPVLINDVESAVPNGDDSKDSTEKDSLKVAEEEKTEKAGGSDQKPTYILLGVVLIVLIVLILYVAIKRRRANQRNRDLTDPESPRSTEMLDMDKKNLGKPINKNGNTEHIPLMGGRDKTDFAKPVNGEKKTPYKPNEGMDSNLQEPLLKKLDNIDEPDKPTDNNPELESNNNIPPISQHSPVVENQQPKVNSPVSKDAPPVKGGSEPPLKTEPTKGGYPPPKSKSPSAAGDDEVFLPSSPNKSRYSPVYSPETGRVKIKLTETAKPKTPILVTRSRSNAGDIVTVPNHDQRTLNGH